LNEEKGRKHSHSPVSLSTLHKRACSNWNHTSSKHIEMKDSGLENSQNKRNGNQATSVHLL